MKRVTAIVGGLCLFSASIHAFGQDALPPAWSLPTASTDYGAYPREYEAIVKAWYEDRLKDPGSAIYKRISAPRQEYMIVNKDQKLAAYGYSVCATVNAKNSYGAYGGAETTWFMIRDGKILRTIDMQKPFGTIISRGHPINCDDGLPAGN